MRSTLLRFLDGWHVTALAIAAILLLTLVVTAGVRWLLRARAAGLRARGVTPWRSAMIDAVSAPLQCLLWVAGLSLALDQLNESVSLPLLRELFRPTRDVAVIALVAWALMRVVPQLTRGLAQHQSTLDETLVDAVNKTAIALIVMAAALVAAQSLGFSMASLLTFGGVAGIAIGFAAQGLVANLLGGITVYASKPFGVGDHIILPGTKLRGTVQEIGWRATRILGWDGRPFYVPNAKFNTETIINHTRIAYRQLAETVLVRLEDVPRIPAIVAAVNAMLEQHPEMQHANRYFIFRLNGYTAQAATLRLYAYTKSTSYADFMAAKEDILLQIAAIIAAHGAQLAIPPQALYAPHGLGGPVAPPDTAPWPGEPPRPA